jgi:formate dehydrogenase subunit gamma
MTRKKGVSDMSQNNQKMVKVTDGIERIVHWGLAVSCLFCLVSGLGFMFHSWSIIPTVLGGYYATKWMHIFSGLFFAAFLVYAFFMWKRYCEFEPDDAKWIINGGGYLWPTKNLPPVYKYNARQKAYFWCIVAFGVIIAVTGVMMWNADMFPNVIMRWAFMFHALSAMVIGSFFMVHLYLGTIGNPGTASAMFTGKCSRAWCQTHCPRWLEERDNYKPEAETKAG